LPSGNLSLRHSATTAELYSKSESRSISNLRLEALKHAEDMITTDPEIYNWVQLGPTAIPHGQTDSSSRVLVTGRVTAIAVDFTDPNVIYLGTALGGVWKTIDGGRNWIPTSDNAESLAIGTLVMDPKHHNVLYAGTGEGNVLRVTNEYSYYGCGVLKTINGGEEWLLKGSGHFNGSRFFRLAINPIYTNIIFAATSIGLYRSIDFGEEWSAVTLDLPKITDKVKAATDIVIDPNDSRIVYVAFWGDGIYKSENASDDIPRWKKLPIKLPTDSITRIALGISQSSPQTLYTLMSDINDSLNKFYSTKDGGSSWYQIQLPSTPIQLPSTIMWNQEIQNGITKVAVDQNGIGCQGAYNINVAVDPTTADTVYLSGVPLLKAVRNPITNIWGFSDIGRNIHTDHHALAFHPTDNFIIYDASDGGIYKSNDGGITWNDVINEGLCITQFEFIDQHPESDSVIFGGTQDNGTEVFRNNSVFYHSDDGDGGFVAIDTKEPNVVIHGAIGTKFYRSEEGGKFGNIKNGGSWEFIDNNNVEGVASITSLFYPPFTLDQQNPKNAALGTYKFYLDDNQGKNGWKVNVPRLRDLIDKDFISAINYVNSNLIYVGTTGGKIIQLINKGTWIAKTIHDTSLPAMYVWDIAAYPGRDDVIFIVMGGFLKEPRPRIWRGEVPEDGVAGWTDISGKGNNMLPDIPINAIAIEPKKPETMYIGTDIGVFRTTNGGESWAKFGRRLPRSPVFDMRLHYPTRLLRAATHGRGLWELKLDERKTPDIDLYVRDHHMDTGRSTSSSTQSLSGVTIPFEDPLQHLKLGQKLFWYMCSDIKIDPPFYQMDIDEVDYVKFECRIEDRDIRPGQTNRIYVQVHNRGIKAVEIGKPALIKVLYSNAMQGENDTIKFPDLPHDFWEKFPHDSSDTTSWKPIGEAKQLPFGVKTLTNTEPTVIEWDWNVPPNMADMIGLLVIVCSTDDPIPDENKKIFNIEDLVRSEKHVGIKLKNTAKI
jgi:photosystem II stability/assembly factor-like uncharacterized protein